MSPSTLAPLAKSKAKLRAAARGLTIEQLEKLSANLQALIRYQRERESAKAIALKKAKIAKIKALMAESGLSPEDLKGGGKRGRPAKGVAKKATKRPKRKVAPKYRLVVDGTEHLWSGRGRPPKAFKEYMDAGKSKQSCAI